MESPIKTLKDAKESFGRMNRIHRMACVPRLMLGAPRLLILPTPFILSVFPFVYLAVLAGHPMSVSTKRTQIKKLRHVFAMGCEMNG